MSLQIATYKYLSPYINTRAGEKRIGESLSFFEEQNWEDSLINSDAEYIIVGIEEDLGPRANLGKGGAQETWKAFLKVFLNMQNNRFIDTNNFQILGSINFEKWSNKELEVAELRTLVSDNLDIEVQDVISKIIQANKTPIVIGGGHNNALPLMRSIRAKSDLSKIGILNLDPHADFRPDEGRHSGNSFSIAKQENTINKYAVIGLNKAYNSELMLQSLENEHCKFYFSDDIVAGLDTLSSQFEDAVRYLEDCDTVGIELDLDSIKNIPVSAMTPSGIQVEDARSYLIHAIHVWGRRIAYFNLTEGAPKHMENGEMIIGKTLSYMVHDIIQHTLGKN